jgi:hypothetical protein
MGPSVAMSRASGSWRLSDSSRVGADRGEHSEAAQGAAGDHLSVENGLKPEKRGKGTSGIRWPGYDLRRRWRGTEGPSRRPSVDVGPRRPMSTWKWAAWSFTSTSQLNPSRFAYRFGLWGGGEHLMIVARSAPAASGSSIVQLDWRGPLTPRRLFLVNPEFDSLIIPFPNPRGGKLASTPTSSKA